MINLTHCVLLLVGRTVLVIAHRLSTIRDADIIAVISKGQVKEVSVFLLLVLRLLHLALVSLLSCLSSALMSL